MAEQEEDFSSLPFADRFVHKNWKVRKQAYEDAAKSFESTADESDPAFRPFLQDPGLWKGAAADSNVAAQQDGLTALCAFLRLGGVQAATRTRNLTITPIYEKGLSSTRPAAKASALEALLLYVELDKSDPVIEELLPALSHKQPKIIAATLAAISALFHNFGIKIVEPKPILKTLPKVFGHADKNVRAEAQNVTVELYRWLREAMKPVFWGDLKPVQQQDLEKLFETVKAEAPPKQERFTRAQQDAMAAATARGGDEMGEEAAGEIEEEGGDFVEVDAFDLAEPVDVMSKVPKDLHDNLASTKWKDRKDALDGLYTAVNVPRIKDGPFDDIVRALAKCMKDANIAVVTVAATCIEALAKGLRKGFGKYRSTIMSPIMERFKEKKQSVADALGAALDAVFASTNLTDCLEETLGFLTHKNPQIKLESVKFLIRCLRTTRDVPDKAEVKSIADAGTKLLTESSEVTRAGGAEVLGTLMKIMGERAMGPYLDGLDDIRKTKIKEFFETAEVKAKDRPKPIVAPPKAIAAGGKKAVGGKKPGPGLKKPAPAATPPVAAPPTPSAMPQPRPGVNKGIPSKLSAPKSGLTAPSAGLKGPGQRRLAGPGGAAPPHPMSPLRPITSPTEDPPPSISKPKFGLAGPGRGLAGRTLSKPITASSVPEPPLSPPVNNALSTVERAELEELRAEKESLTRQNEELKSSVQKFQSQINELQNQNAQLIEDHTRDVLSIKAKETQLVRARSDAEAAEQTVQKQQREMDRLKRELSRSVRATSPPPRTSIDLSGIGVGDGGIYRDGSTNGRPMSTRFDSAASVTSQTRPRSYMLSSPSEEKENSDFGVAGRRPAKVSPPMTTGSSHSGRASPSKMGRAGSGGAGMERGDGDNTAGGGKSASGEPAENWKRAAEVTSQLKARIEQMKARQGLARH